MYMLYVIITFFLLLLLIAIVRVYYSIRVYNNLNDGTIVYHKRGPINDSKPDDYYEARIKQDQWGNKYIGGNLIKCWDVIKGDIITEEQYTILFD